ncbi:hypothetical protein BFJ67_g15682, partial [Fusarium oxysporum f. sp. cepae]
GFSASPGDYFLARAANEPPYVLQKQLWPWIEEWEPRFEARARRQCWAEGGLDDDDLAADGFLKLMRRLRIVLLQDLAVLQPRYPSLPFFAYAPFNGSEWDEFAVAVRSDAVGATEPLSLLVQRALPELSGVLESTREALLQNSQRLAIRLEARLEGIQGGLDSLLQGKVPITFTGHFGAGPAVSLAPAPAPSTAPTLNFNAAPAPAPEPPVPGMPVVAALVKVFTVLDVWKEWEEGIAGQPAVRVLEETWGSRWRPGNGIRVQFCRRKVIWDELLARTASGKSEEEAVAELELLRAGRSLNRLVDELKQRRRRGQGRLRVQFPGVKNMRCLKHLYVTDPRDDKQRILETKGGLLKGSYCWILKNDRFQRFRDDPQSPLLWIKGDLGKGKTMLLCGIIDELEKESAKRLSYFFCQATEAQLSSATGVLRGLIYLLIIQQPSLIS